MEAPCELNGQPTPDIGWAWDCPIDFGLCVICGRTDGLPWEPMNHEEYGAWWMSRK